MYIFLSSFTMNVALIDKQFKHKIQANILIEVIVWLAKLNSNSDLLRNPN